jgi:type IV secretory pathway TraG/TraD family ATPase VirD4
MSKPKILLGEKWDPKTGRVSGEVFYELESHITLIAPTGAGKGTMLEIPNLLTGLRDISVLSIDPSGQNAAVCAQARLDMKHDTVILNPFNLHKEIYADLEDAGCNPLLTLKVGDPKFCEDAMSLADACITPEGDSQPHFPNEARGLVTWLIMYMRIQHGTSGTLGHVRDALCGNLEQIAGEVFDTQPAKLGPAQRVIKQHGEDGAIAFAFERAGVWRVQKPLGLRIGQGRSLTLVRALLGTRNTLDGVVGDGVGIAQMVEQIR